MNPTQKIFLARERANAFEKGYGDALNGRPPMENPPLGYHEGYCLAQEEWFSFVVRKIV